MLSLCKFSSDTELYGLNLTFFAEQISNVMHIRALCWLKFLFVPAPHPQEFEKSCPLPSSTHILLTRYRLARLLTCALKKDYHSSVPNQYNSLQAYSQCFKRLFSIVSEWHSYHDNNQVARYTFFLRLSDSYNIYCLKISLRERGCDGNTTYLVPTFLKQTRIIMCFNSCERSFFERV